MAKTLTSGPIPSLLGAVDGAERTERQRVLVLGLFCLAAYMAIALSNALFAPFPNHIDELAHVSYVATIAQHGIAGLDLGTMRMLSPAQTSGLTTEANYLNHPPFYYLMMSWLLPANGWPTLATIEAMRLANLALSSLAVACALGVGMVRRLEPRIFLLYALMVIVTPVLWSIGGAINNDNLAILGGSASILGAQLLEEDRGSRSGQVMLVAGCTLAMLAKLTSGVMTVAFAAIFLSLQWREAGRPSRRLLVVLVTFVALACIPYLCFLAEYGSPAPITPGFVNEYRRIAELFATHPDTVVHGWKAGQHLGFIGYAAQFAWWLLTDWNPNFGPESLLNLAVLLVPVVLLSLTVFAWLGNLRPRRDQDKVILAGGIALIALVPLHLMFSYQMYLAAVRRRSTILPSARPIVDTDCGLLVDRPSQGVAAGDSHSPAYGWCRRGADRDACALSGRPIERHSYSRIYAGTGAG
jgi:4-amino-4-deoxy-L-arabinose transferase-like glycosyltransferase